MHLQECLLMPTDNAFPFKEKKKKPLWAQHVSRSECLLPFCETKDILILQLLICIILHVYITVSFQTVLEMNLQCRVFKRNKFSQNIQGRVWPYFVPVKWTQHRKQEAGFWIQGRRISWWVRYRVIRDLKSGV